MSAVIGALRAVLSLDSAGFNKGVGAAQKRLRGFQKRMEKTSRNLQRTGRRMSAAITAPLVGGAALAVRSSLQAIDAQAKLAQSFGTTTKSMQVMARAGDLAGVSMGQIEMGLIALTKRLSQAAAGGGPAADALERLNLKAEDLLDLPVDERVAKIQTAIADLVPAAEQAAVASQLFGDRAAVMFSRIDADVLAQATAEINRFGVAVSEVDADQIERTNDAISALGLVTRGLANQLAVTLAPMLENLAESLANLSEWFAGVSDKTKKWMVVIAGIASAIGPALIALGLMAKGAALAAAALSGIGTAVAVLAGVVSAPVAAIVAVVAGIGIAAYKVWENWETIGPQLEALWLSVSTAAQDAWSSLTGQIEATTVAVLKSLGDMWTAVLEEIKSWPAEFVQLGRDLVQGLVDGITEKIEAVRSTVRGVAQGVIGWFKDETEVRSPSRVFMRIGRDLMAGLGIGIKDNADQPQRELSNVAGSMTGIGTAFSTLGSQAAAGFSDIVRGAEQANEVVSRLLDTLADSLLQGAAQSVVKSVFGDLGSVAFAGVPSFAGGGFTGSGARSGGVDGQGGFPAVLHPNETVIDHTRWSPAPAAPAGNTYHIDATGADVQAIARLEAWQQRMDAGGFESRVASANMRMHNRRGDKSWR